MKTNMNEIDRKYNVVVNRLEKQTSETRIERVSENFFDLIEKYVIEHDAAFSIDVFNEYRKGALESVTKTIAISRETFMAFTERLAEATE